MGNISSNIKEDVGTTDQHRVESPNSTDKKEETFQHGLSGLTSLIINNSEIFDKAVSSRQSAEAILTLAIDAKDSYTHAHSNRVADLAIKLAECLGFQDEELRELRLAALLHDVGKIGLPSKILMKPDKLTKKERRVLEMHPIMSAEIINYFQFASSDVALAVCHHHERVDGTGYPDQLRGADIPLSSRILAIADAWDAMTANRPYKKASTQHDAASELRSKKNTQFDDMLVDMFLIVQSSSLRVS